MTSACTYTYEIGYNPSLGVVTRADARKKGVQEFLSTDPLTSYYPMLTPYQFASNTPISAIDLDGLEAFVAIYEYNLSTQKETLIDVVFDEDLIPLPTQLYKVTKIVDAKGDYVTSASGKDSYSNHSVQFPNFSEYDFTPYQDGEWTRAIHADVQLNLTSGEIGWSADVLGIDPLGFSSGAKTILFGGEIARQDDGLLGLGLSSALLFEEDRVSKVGASLSYASFGASYSRSYSLDTYKPVFDEGSVTISLPGVRLTNNEKHEDIISTRTKFMIGFGVIGAEFSAEVGINVTEAFKQYNSMNRQWSESEKKILDTPQNGTKEFDASQY